MSKKSEIEASWKEFEDKKREQEFLDGLTEFELLSSMPYTPTEKWANEESKERFMNGEDLGLDESQIFNIVKESVKRILREQFNICDYVDYPDKWISSLARNGQKMGLTPEEIETLIKKRVKEQDDYQIDQLNKKDQADMLRRSGESAMDRRANGVSYGSNGSIRDDSLWNRK